MLWIDDVLVSDEVFEVNFVCNLNACKGACCVEGDFGAPLQSDEPEILEREYEHYKSYLMPEGIAVLEQQGFSVEVEDEGEKTLHTPLIEGGACAYINYENGVAICGIERAYLDGKTTYKKPISCHLYPIRVSQLGELEAVNYEKWDICDSGCALGKTLGVPVFQFLKEPLVRAYGEEFFEAMTAYYNGQLTMDNGQFV